MPVHLRPEWQTMKDADATDESLFWNRRAVIKSMGLAGLALGGVMASGKSAQAVTDPSAGLYPVARNPAFATGDVAGQAFPITDEKVASVYNNYYEFFSGIGTSKNIWKAAQKLELRPWTVTIDGLVESPKVWDADALLAAMPLEERVYRHRCVETWAMTVPWSGFALRHLVALAKPLSSARYLRFETFVNPDVAIGQRNSRYPYPYVEGLTIEEAANDLSFMATGVYGKPLPKQMGAPFRLALPWKYGFKSSKGLVRISFTDQQPVSFWEQLNAREYGFWANINPQVAHPRWSQAHERDIGTGDRRPTLLYNGYAAQVASLYDSKIAGLGQSLYR